jgi:NAD-reducing hydrogenase large subunit
VAIRAFDPCLSCATHALGKMPLAVEIVDAAGALVRGWSATASGWWRDRCASW